MPDISMCARDDCLARTACHRFTAEPNQFRQAWMAFSYDEELGRCDSFWWNGETVPDGVVLPVGA